MAKGICALDAMCRWAVTGTPIQNRLRDFSALLKFLRVHPYSDRKMFESDIANLWKVGEVDEAVKRLKRLSHCILLRRPQNTVKLPSRRDLRCTVKFTPPERQLYDSIRNQVIRGIDEANAEAAANSHSASNSAYYFNVLQQIEAMRMVCNLGLHYHSRSDVQKAFQSLPAMLWQDWSAQAQQVFDLHRNMDSLQCQFCELPLDSVERLQALDQPLFSRCFRFTCADCAQLAGDHTRRCGCGSAFGCDIAPVSITVTAMEDGAWSQGQSNDPIVLQNPFLATATLPTKIGTLVTQIRALPLGVKWYVTNLG